MKQLAEDIYGKKYPGNLFNDSSITCGSQRCETPIIRLAHKDNETESNLKRPQILLLGNYGGETNEGTAALITYISMLCQYYGKHPTLTHILRTRDIWMLPFPNSWGFYHLKTDELGIDPSVDFPYKVKNGECFKTRTTRIINEVVSENLFQIAINFRHGSPAIGLSWYSYNHTPCNEIDYSTCSRESPETISQDYIADAMSEASGTVEIDSNPEIITRYMSVRRRNSSIEFSPGVFENWISAASWDNGSIPEKCFAPDQYPSKLEIYYNSFSKRSSSFSIETPRLKVANKTFKTYLISDIINRTNHDPQVIRTIRAIHKAVELLKPEIIHQTKPILISTNPTSTNLKVQFLAIGCLHIDYMTLVVKPRAKFNNRLHRISIFRIPKKCRSISPWDNWNSTSNGEWEPTQNDVIDVNVTIPIFDNSTSFYFEYSFDSYWNKIVPVYRKQDPKSLFLLARSSEFLNIQTSNAKLACNSHSNQDTLNKAQQGAIYVANYCHSDANSNVSVTDEVEEFTQIAKKQSFASNYFSLDLKIARVCLVQEANTHSNSTM
ncbi:uncharacterized protein LOC128882639 isoform X2 [Hylaeus volcanicus]|uniref:uncharacterized protein LOC128882639 isoform X2 n=1 Tax=Hylaeus volcanicus TaxID=313075 RepID=UPI0023B80096|nr:uncharacterized protein LOC128882639 isoform X2 [Hylaeus volcanicus]